MKSVTWSTGLLRLAALTALLTLSLLLGGRGALHAQTGDCDDPDTVACIPPADPGSAAPGPASAPSTASGAAAPAAAPPYRVCPPTPPPPPYPYPYPLPASASAAAASPPAPTYCFNDIFSTLNRANLAYARAMRSLDPSLLRGYWAQDALDGLRSQIAQLRATGTYMSLRLVTIRVLDQSFSPYGAWVHTSEHWIMDTWSYDGYQYDHQDAWYDNQYFLYRSAGGWLIGTDIVN